MDRKNAIGKRGQGKGNNQISQEPTFNYSGKALWYPLNKVEYGQAKEKYSEAEIFQIIDKLLDSGYGMSIKPTADGNLKVSLLGYSGVNEGLMLTVIASSFLYACRCLCYRHFDYYNEEWKTWEEEHD